MIFLSGIFTNFNESQKLYNVSRMLELTEVLLRYGVYNACNLDGGGSTVLVEKGKLINSPVSYQGAGERNVLNAVILR